MSIQKLPTDAVAHVLSMLDIPDLPAVIQTTRALRRGAAEHWKRLWVQLQNAPIGSEERFAADQVASEPRAQNLSPSDAVREVYQFHAKHFQSLLFTQPWGNGNRKYQPPKVRPVEQLNFRQLQHITRDIQTRRTEDFLELFKRILPQFSAEAQQHLSSIAHADQLRAWMGAHPGELDRVRNLECWESLALPTETTPLEILMLPKLHPRRFETALRSFVMTHNLFYLKQLIASPIFDQISSDMIGNVAEQAAEVRWRECEDVYLDEMRELLYSRRFPEIPVEWLKMPLTIAIEEKDERLLEHLSQHPQFNNLPDNALKMPFFSAAVNGHLAFLQVLLRLPSFALLKAEEKMSNEAGEIGMALFSAAENGHTDCLLAIAAAVRDPKPSETHDRPTTSPPAPKRIRPAPDPT